MTVGSNTSPLGRGAALYLQGNPQIVRRLPQDGEPRLRGEFHEHVQSSFSRLQEYGIVEKHHIDETSLHAGSTRWYWWVPTDVARCADQVVDAADATHTPCGRCGVRTIEPGTYSCTADGCDCRFGRERAQEVLGS